MRQRGLRQRGILISRQYLYAEISDLEVEEFRTDVQGADAGHSTIIRFTAGGRPRRVGLYGQQRDPDAIIALMHSGADR